MDVDYRRARITINPLHISDLEKLWQVVAHEVAHVVIADFNLFHKVVETSEATDHVWQYACERTTTQLERVFLRERSYEEYGKAKK